MRILRILERPSIPFLQKDEKLFNEPPDSALDWHFSVQKPSRDQTTSLQALSNNNPAIFSLSDLDNNVCAARKQQTAFGNLLAIDADPALVDHAQRL